MLKSRDFQKNFESEIEADQSRNRLQVNFVSIWKKRQAAVTSDTHIRRVSSRDRLADF